jgi:hypothetical protein
MLTLPPMRLFLQSLLLLCISTFALCQNSDEDFTLVRKSPEEGIYVYERWIDFNDVNPPYKAREVKSDFPVDATIEEAVGLLKNEKRIKEWQHHVSEFAVFPTDDTATWFEYSYHDIPWPVSDQDHYLQYTVKSAEKDHVHITFESKVSNKFPVKEDVTRMHLSGSWTFTRKSDGSTHASYRIMSKPIGIPRMFTDPVIRNNIMTTISRYREILGEK